MDFKIQNKVIIGPGITITYRNPEPPTNTALPEISGVAQVRITINCSTGTWVPGIPAPITGYEYQWQLNEVDIIGATTNSYTVISSDVGDRLRCIVTATNATGSTDAFSIETPIVLPNTPLPPLSVVATGSPVGTATITFTPNDDGGSPITSYTATSNAGGFTNTASSSPITITGINLGTPYYFNVIATNSVGNSDPAQSNTITFSVSVGLSDTITGYLNSCVVRVSPDNKFVYVVCDDLPGAGTPQIIIFSRDLTTGILTYSSVYNNGNIPKDLLISPDNNYCYILYSGLGIYQYTRNTSTGALTFMPGGIAPAGNGTVLGISVDGKNVFSSSLSLSPSLTTTIHTLEVVSGYLVNRASIQVSGTVAININQIFTSNDSKSVYAGGLRAPSTYRIFQLDRDTSTGALSNPQSYIPDTSYSRMAISYDDKSLYTACKATSLQHFTRNTINGNLTLTNTYTGHTNSNILIPASDNALLCDGGNYSRNTTTGNLTYLNSNVYATGTVVSNSMTISPDDHNIYVVTDASATAVRTYTISG